MQLAIQGWKGRRIGGKCVCAVVQEGKRAFSCVFCVVKDTKPVVRNLVCKEACV